MRPMNFQAEISAMYAKVNKLLIIDAERRWASKLIRKEVTENLPNLQAYLDALYERRSNNLAWYMIILIRNEKSLNSASSLY